MKKERTRGGKEGRKQEGRMDKGGKGGERRGGKGEVTEERKEYKRR